MRILLTGASGGIGSAACHELHRRGHEVVATDRADRGNIPVKLHVVNLLDRHAVAALCDRLDAVIHLGNHIDYDPPDPQMIFGENMVMNINVLAAAQAGGARKMIFASSVQAFASRARLPDNRTSDRPPYLPLDGEIPEFATNFYALSKACGEDMLRFYARVYDTQAVAIRFPWTREPGHFEVVARTWREKYQWLVPMGFCYLLYSDAARLIGDIIASDLPGYRCYFPTSHSNMLQTPSATIVAEFFAGVPIRKPLNPKGSLADTSRITAETGWEPSE
jgi:nucleoside-diphosphate-sugar epimerase